MIKLTITALESPITVQDGSPSSLLTSAQPAISVDANSSKTVVMQWEQLERIQAQLDALTQNGLCTFLVEGAGTGYTEQADNVSNPVIDYADDGVVTAASQALVVTGSNILGDGSVSSAVLIADTVAGTVAVESVDASSLVNLYDIEIVDSTVGGLAVAVNVVAGRTVITVDLGGSATETCTTVAAIINNAVSATYGLVHATVVGVGATVVSTLQAVTAFLGGLGTGLAVSLAGLPCIVVSIDVTGAPIGVLTLATPVLTPLSLATGAPLNLQIRSNSKVSNITLTHA